MCVTPIGDVYRALTARGAAPERDHRPRGTHRPDPRGGLAGRHRRRYPLSRLRPGEGGGAAGGGDAAAAAKGQWRECWSRLPPSPNARPGCARPRRSARTTASSSNSSPSLKLHTVCESAACPNVGECWNRRTATFMILGNVCTRRCGFCAVQKGAPLAVDYDEPRRVAEAVRRLGLALRRDHQRQPRRPQGWRRRAVRADHPRHPRAHSRLRRRGAGARFPGQPGRHGDRHGRPSPTC